MVLDRCWFVVCPNNKGIVYTSPSQSAHEAWEKATKISTHDGVRSHLLGTGYTREYMEKLGYKARRLDIVFR